MSGRSTIGPQRSPGRRERLGKKEVGQWAAGQEKRRKREALSDLGCRTGPIRERVREMRGWGACGGGVTGPLGCSPPCERTSALFLFFFPLLLGWA